jgi:pimeloyl-ACP methyl ester carboxylesterase
VLLHGLLDSSEGWTRLCSAFGGTRIAFDLPGFGSSDPPPRGTLGGYARDVAEGLDALGVDSFTLVGHSLGGGVGAALAELMPERIEAMILLAPAGFGPLYLADVVSLPGVRNLVDAALPRLLTNRVAVGAGYMAAVSNGTTPDPGLVERVTSRGEILAGGVREATRAVVDAGRAPDGFHRRRMRYRGPVTAVWGDRDLLVPAAHRRGVRTAFPHAEIEVWRGMGHHAARERFDDLVDCVARTVGTARAAPRRSNQVRAEAA